MVMTVYMTSIKLMCEQNTNTVWTVQNILTFKFTEGIKCDDNKNTVVFIIICILILM